MFFARYKHKPKQTKKKTVEVRYHLSATDTRKLSLASKVHHRVTLAHIIHPLFKIFPILLKCSLFVLALFYERCILAETSWLPVAHPPKRGIFKCKRGGIPCHTLACLTGCDRFQDKGEGRERKSSRLP